jgi:hypothetical protein
MLNVVEPNAYAPMWDEVVRIKLFMQNSFSSIPTNGIINTLRPVS